MTLKSGALRSAVPLICVLLLVAGCSKVVAGRALISVPRPGSPVEWAPCQAGPSEQPRLLAGAECGMLSVPVDWDSAGNPESGVAQIAMIRYPASGEKIGSLVINVNSSRSQDVRREVVRAMRMASYQMGGA